MADEEQVLLEYVELEEEVANDASKDAVSKTGHVSIHSSGFRDFLLSPEILRAIQDCGFEHPSEVQHECIPRAIVGVDILCQAKSGMGKTAVFVISTLQRLEPVKGECSVLVMCHTRELAFQINREYERFSKWMPEVKCEVFFGGVPVKDNEKTLKENVPNIVVGTPGRIMDLVERGFLKLDKLKFFVLDECDKMLESDMRQQIQEIFRASARDKQVMMFSATLSKAVRPTCKKFMEDPMEVYVDDEAKLTLLTLKQHYCKLQDKEKNKKLFQLLDELQFNQVVIFVKNDQRCMALCKLLNDQNFPASAIYGRLKQEKRLQVYQEFKEFKSRILVATDIFGRGMDIERVNIVFNYDMPEVKDGQEENSATDAYLHRVARAGRFGTKGLAVSFVTSQPDAEILNSVQSRFEISIDELPEGGIDQSVYREES